MDTHTHTHTHMYKQLVETVSCKKAACLCQKPKLMTAHNGHDKCKIMGGRGWVESEVF